MNTEWTKLLLNQTWRWLLALLASVLLLDALGLYWLQLPIYAGKWQNTCGAVGLFSGLALFSWALHRSGVFKQTGPLRLLQRACLLFCSMAYMALFALAVAVLSYLTVKLNAPLVDTQLAQADRWLGFSWLGYFNWVESHPRLSSILLLAYTSTTSQTMVVLLFCSLVAQPRQLMEFLSIFTLSALLVVVVSAIYPAHGAFFHFGKTYTIGARSISDFGLLRSGQLHQIRLDHLQGLIQMPSFHTCMAIMFTYAVRSNRYLLGLALLLNGVMLLSTPYCGGHYLMDMLAGATLMSLVILLVTACQQPERLKAAWQKCSGWRLRPVATESQP